ncbi:MAG: hypothetical protein ACKVQV_08100 [Bacteroidia bacterium]
MKRTSLFVLLAFGIYSCNQPIKNDKAAVNSNVVADTQTVQLNKIPEIFSFSHSDCKTNVTGKDKLISSTHSGDSLILKFGSMQNCIGKFQPTCKLQNDTLALEIKIQEEYRTRKNGKIDTVIVSNDCDCYYYFDFGIKNISSGEKTILLNGHKAMF